MWKVEARRTLLGVVLRRRLCPQSSCGRPSFTKCDGLWSSESCDLWLCFLSDSLTASAPKQRQRLPAKGAARKLMNLHVANVRFPSLSGSLQRETQETPVLQIKMYAALQVSLNSCGMLLIKHGVKQSGTFLNRSNLQLTG